MEDEAWVRAALGGDHAAFARLVERYRNTVYGLAYDQMRDFDGARDVAQEVFVRAFLRLRELRDPAKFASWLYQMTVNECRMRHRAESRILVGISDAMLEHRTTEAPDAAVHQRVLIRQALQCLTADSRRAILLFYFHGHSLQEIAAFLDSSVSAVKSRLRDARARLRREMLEMIEETVKAAPLPDDFSREIVTRLLRAAYEGETEIVRQMLTKDAGLASARGDYSEELTGVVPLRMAAEYNRVDIINLLRGCGAFTKLSRSDGLAVLHAAASHRNRSLMDEMAQLGFKEDIFAACLQGDADAVREFIRCDPQIVHAYDENYGTPLHAAGTPEIAAVLLDAGADIEAVGPFENTPAEYHSYPVGRSIVDLLIHRGAKVSFRLACSRNDVERVTEYLDANPSLANRVGPGLPYGNALPIIIAVIYQALDAVRLLLDRGVDVNSVNADGGGTPLHFAALYGNTEIARLLLSRGADTTIRASFYVPPIIQNAAPITWAQQGECEGWGVRFPMGDSGRHQEIIALLEAVASPEHLVEQSVP